MYVKRGDSDGKVGAIFVFYLNSRQLSVEVSLYKCKGHSLGD